MKVKIILLIFVPAIIVAAFALFASFIQYQPQKISYNDPNRLEILNIVPIFKEDIIIGDLKAPKEIIAFEDLGCPSCLNQMKILEELQNKYPGKIKIILKTLNVTRFPVSSEESHRYLFCANVQNKLIEFRTVLFENNDLDTTNLKYVANMAGINNESLESCLTDQDTLNYIQKNEDLAKQLGIETVPTIFIDSKVIQEPLNIIGWETLLSLP